MLRQAQHDNKRLFCHSEELLQRRILGYAKVSSSEGGNWAGVSLSRETLCSPNKIITPSGHEIPVPGMKAKVKYHIPVPGMKAKVKYHIPVPGMKAKVKYHIPVPGMKAKVKYHIPVPGMKANEEDITSEEEYHVLIGHTLSGSAHFAKKIKKITLNG